MRHERNEVRFPQIEDASLDAIITDIPYNASSTAQSEHAIGGFHDRMAFQRYFGSWDTDFSPLHLIHNAVRALKPGGWLIIFNGDRLFGSFRDFVSQDHITTPYYLEFLWAEEIIDKAAWHHGLKMLKATRVPTFEYKATVAWHKTILKCPDCGAMLAVEHGATTAWHKVNPPTRVRKTTTCSSMEWIQVARRLDDKGKTAKPVAWNFLSQKAMRNFIQGPLCGAPERLYWHVVDPEYADSDDAESEIIGGKIVPCHGKRKCKLCQAGYERRRHGTQKPLYVWDWIYKRYTDPGLTVYDPYAGTGSSGIAARHHKLNWFGSEMLWEYAAVGQMWLEGIWKTPMPDDLKQERMFG